MGKAFDLVIRGGRCVLPAALASADIGVRAGRIGAVGDLAAAEAVDVVDAAGLRTEHIREGPTTGAQGLQAVGQGYGIQLRGKPTPLIGLLGRDVLRNTKFSYDGVKGSFRVVFY